jgi:hypothetical protein
MGRFVTGSAPMSPEFPRRALRSYSQDHKILPMFMQRDSIVTDQHRKISLPPPGMRKTIEFR